MNNIFCKTTLIGCSALLLCGCNDFLETEVVGYATEENYYNTQYKMQTVLNSVYDVLQSDDYNDQEWRFGEACGDDVIGTNEDISTNMGQLVNFRFDTSNPWILQRWEVNYEGVHRANQVIYNIDKVEISTNTYSDYQQIRYILGQAKFLRALYYFNLVKTFGGVPIRPESEDVNNLVIARSSLEECYAYIEKDLREAAIMLPSTWDVTELGKATCGAAVALLMKVLMYQASPGVESEKWEEMVTLGDYFINNTTLTYGDILQYDGTEDWEDLRLRLWFQPKELSTEDTYETTETTMLNISSSYSLEYKDYYGDDLHGGDKWAYVYQWYSDGEFCRGSVFEVVFAESGDGTDGDTNEGAGIDHFSVGNVVMYAISSIVSDIFGTDYRSNYLIHHQGNTPDGEIWQGGEGRYVSLKWYTPKKDKPQYAGDNGKNRRLIRYVDVVLMYAEALNECDEREEALTWLNTCKAQVNSINSSSSVYVAGGYAYIRDQIWEERRMELCYEWERFFDIVRQRRAATVLHTFGSGRANSRGMYFIEGVNEIFPIPQNEIDVSNGVVEQNPGY